MINDTSRLKNYLLKFLLHGVMPAVGTILGYAASYVLRPLLFTVITPIIHSMEQVFPNRLFDNKVSIVVYIIDIGLLVVFVVCLVRTVIQARSLVAADSSEFPADWVDHAKKFLFFGFWAGLCLSQFLFRILLPWL